MTLSREELARDFAVALVARDGYTATSAAQVAVVAADALLLALTPAPVAPPAGKYEPKVGDKVCYFGNKTDPMVVSRVTTSGAIFYRNLKEDCRYDVESGNPGNLVYLGRATQGELARVGLPAAGLAVPPPAPTPAPEANRPAVYSHLRCEPDRWEFLESLHRWYESSPLLADALLSYDKRKESLKPCPPPVAGSARRVLTEEQFAFYEACRVLFLTNDDSPDHKRIRDEFYDPVWVTVDAMKAAERGEVRP